MKHLLVDSVFWLVWFSIPALLRLFGFSSPEIDSTFLFGLSLGCALYLIGLALRTRPRAKAALNLVVASGWAILYILMALALLYSEKRSQADIVPVLSLLLIFGIIPLLFFLRRRLCFKGWLPVCGRF